MRLSTNQTYALVLNGLQTNLGDMVRYSEQVSTGRRINRPSDDPTGAALSLGFERRIADIERSAEAARSGRDTADGAAGVLEEVSSLVSQVRALMIQGMNGTLDPQSREAISSEVALLREQLVTLGNTRQGNRYLFAGSKTDTRPFADGPDGRVNYFGDNVQQEIRIGPGVGIPINVSGQSLFMLDQGSGPSLSGFTGLAFGASASEGEGSENVTVRHDATDLSGLAGSGIASVAGGANDTLIGPANLVVDTTAGTIQMGSGTPVPIPAVGSENYTDLVVESETGAKLHLDLTLWNGADVAGPVSGDGSVSIDGVNFQAIDFSLPEVRLENPETGSVLNVNVANVTRAGDELIQFSGDVSLFDVLDAVAADLANSENYTSDEISKRLGMNLDELDRHHDNVLSGLGVLGSRSSRLSDAANRLDSLEINVQSQLSTVRDTDLAEAVLALQRSEQVLQLSQAVGSRLIQTSLLNFL
jgi:flagellar hook-associated protein 3 FlgL